MALKTTRRGINGSANRHCESWIERFVEHTRGLESDPIYRRWTAITTIAATLQMKVWAPLQGDLYPNLYVFLVGRAGIGKSRPITFMEKIIRKVNEDRKADEKIALSPTSTTMASLTDKLAEAQRIIPIHPGPAIVYNSLYVMADELTTFMNDFKAQNDLIAGLTKYYDCSPYSQARRTNAIDKAIDSPQLNILAGSTPSNLLQFIPQWAWDQGFTSRLIFVYADKKHMIDPFKEKRLLIPDDLVHDLETIDSLVGQMGWTEGYHDAVIGWRDSGMQPEPTHPRLDSYRDRRWSHLLKLTMIAAVDRSNTLMLTEEDAERAKGWLLEAESRMGKIFETGNSSQDGKAIDDIHHFIQGYGNKGVAEHLVKNFARNIINTQAIKPTIDMMIEAHLVEVISYTSIGTRVFKATSSG